MLYLMTKAAYNSNRAGVGEVFIGGSSVYFGDKFYTWKSKWATLEKVAFEPGDPCVVQFDYRVGNGDEASRTEVRVPVPRGREAEALLCCRVERHAESPPMFGRALCH